MVFENDARSSLSSTPLVLDRRVQLFGTLYYDGAIRLSGTVEGSVECKEIEISERGSVSGDVVAERVIVMGEVSGSIFANELVLRTGSVVEGDIFHQNLQLEDGCFFEGRSRRAPQPIELAASLSPQNQEAV